MRKLTLSEIASRFNVHNLSFDYTTETLSFTDHTFPNTLKQWEERSTPAQQHLLKLYVIAYQSAHELVSVVLEQFAALTADVVLADEYHVPDCTAQQLMHLVSTLNPVHLSTDNDDGASYRVETDVLEYADILDEWDVSGEASFVMQLFHVVKLLTNSTYALNQFAETLKDC